MGSPQEPAEPVQCFIADSMLGRLARWLRILGYDTAYEKRIKGEALVERAVHEQRWLLTRDRRLALRKLLPGRHTLIMNDLAERQLSRLHRDLKIDLDMTNQRDCRCADCNVVLIFISPEVAVPLVPPFVGQHYETFLLCPRCRKGFWPGTHWDDLRSRIAAIKRHSADTTEAR
jgi:uncharacterized protein